MRQREKRGRPSVSFKERFVKSVAVFGCLARTVMASAFLFGMGQTAQAGPVTLSFSGTVANGWDSSNIFGGGNLTGNQFAASLTFNPSGIGASSCGASTNTTSCNWSLSGGTSFTQSLTMIAGGHSYTRDFTGAMSSSLSLNSSGNDAMYLSFGGSGFSLSLNAVALAQDAFFANQANVNDLAFNFTNIALNAGSSAEYGNWGSTSFTLTFDKLSATSGSGMAGAGSADASAVSEPSALALLAAAVIGLTLIRRRKRILA